LKWSPTSGLFVARSGGRNGTVMLGGGAGIVATVVSWRSGVARTLRTFRFASEKSQVATAFALSNDALRFASAERVAFQGPSTIFVRDAGSGATLDSLSVEDEVQSLVFSPDGKMLYLQLRNNKGGGALQKWALK
jgi:hypothetical protein